MPQRLALVTGASSGVGRAAAGELARRGWKVILTARRAAETEAAARAIGPAAIALPADVSDPAEVERLTQAVLQTGLPDAILNCAGAGRWLRLEDTPPAELQSMLGAPLLADALVCRAFLPGMRAHNSGVLIHVNSPAAHAAWPHAAAYTAARAGLYGLHKALRQDLAGSGITSCHATFGRISSDYFTANPGVADRMPDIARTIRTLSPDDCARILADLAERPRPEVTAPALLAFYMLSNRLFPGLIRWLLRATAPR